MIRKAKRYVINLYSAVKMLAVMAKNPHNANTCVMLADACGKVIKEAAEKKQCTVLDVGTINVDTGEEGPLLVSLWAGVDPNGSPFDRLTTLAAQRKEVQDSLLDILANGVPTDPAKLKYLKFIASELN